MELEEAKKILLNCYPMKTTHVLDDTNRANKEAIEVVLKEIEYLKKNQRYKKDFNGEKIFCLEYDKETLRDMVLEKQEEIKELKSNSIPKDKIRKRIKVLKESMEMAKLNNLGRESIMFIDGSIHICEKLLEEE